MFVEIITPEKKIFSGNATSILLPGVGGLFEVLENHTPLISALKNGTIKLVSEGETQFFEINSGVVEVLKNKVEALVECLAIK